MGLAILFSKQTYCNIVEKEYKHVCLDDVFCDAREFKQTHEEEVNVLCFSPWQCRVISILVMVLSGTFCALVFLVFMYFSSLMLICVLSFDFG